MFTIKWFLHVIENNKETAEGRPIEGMRRFLRMSETLGVPVSTGLLLIATNKGQYFEVYIVILQFNCKLLQKGVIFPSFSGLACSLRCIVCYQGSKQVQKAVHNATTAYCDSSSPTERSCSWILRLRPYCRSPLKPCRAPFWKPEWLEKLLYDQLWQMAVGTQS